ETVWGAANGRAKPRKPLMAAPHGRTIAEFAEGLGNRGTNSSVITQLAVGPRFPGKTTQVKPRHIESCKQLSRHCSPESIAVLNDLKTCPPGHLVLDEDCRAVFGGECCRPLRRLRRGKRHKRCRAGPE